MQTAEKISITMTPEMMVEVRASVAAGEYASTSEVLRDAVRVWQRLRAEQAERLASIRARAERAVGDLRPSLTGQEIKDRLSSLHAETVKAHRNEAV
ncbi:ribbon-helix-helix domain-containing protein [Bosea sp. 124]|uniref:ribbon-helix-helix domain-containing protein n=1 Tax=Bosea sp. 124 TaxID=2135642 RepID=UPI000D3BCCCA|nr:ribbon-helix-helix domain-containing protein [Bosea sp. 124]PTM43565.1 antitoxin ParD1/3/4 [Bosea sp. 124]